MTGSTARESADGVADGTGEVDGTPGAPAAGARVMNGVAATAGDGVGPAGGVGRTVGLSTAAGVGVGVRFGVGTGAGVGARVGAGVAVGLGVGAGVGAGVEVPLTVNDKPIVLNWPEPHFVEPAEPGLSKAVAVHDRAPAVDAVPLIWKTAESPVGSPTSGFLSEGFLNAMRVVPPDEVEYACQPCVAADVTPLTETTANELTEKDAGMSTATHVISSPPPLPPTFCAVKVMAVCTPAWMSAGDRASVHALAARTAPGAAITATNSSAAMPAQRPRRPVTPPSARVSTVSMPMHQLGRPQVPPRCPE
jgi:hypothetical protein